MKKEVGIAILFGVILGLIVAFYIIFQIRQTQSKPSSINVSPAVSGQPKQQVVTENALDIIEPNESEVFNAKSIMIKGTASKDSLLVIQSPNGEKTMKLTKNDFNVPFDLAIGENVIQIAVYPKDTQSHIQQRTLIVYYFEKL